MIETDVFHSSYVLAPFQPPGDFLEVCGNVLTVITKSIGVLLV